MTMLRTHKENQALKTYEAVFILDPKKVEDGGEALAKGVSEQAEALGGKVQRAVPLGRRQFARPLGKHRAGVYWDIVLDLQNEAVAAFKDRYRLNSAVLRLEVFLFEEGSDPARLTSPPRGDRDRDFGSFSDMGGGRGR
jgi:small subunit ribosomal protein S6